MKKKLIACCLLFFYFLSVDAQLPNSGFEDWEIIDSLEQPLFWQTNNFENYISVTKSDDAHEGDYAVQLIANAPTFEGFYPGEVSMGYRITDDNFPAVFSVWGKCLPYPMEEEGACRLTMLFFNQGAYVHISDTSFNPDILEFTKLELWNDLPSTAIVDSVKLIISGGSIVTGLGAYGNAFFIVDKAGIEMTPTHSKEGVIEERALFPNPATNLLYIKGFKGSHLRLFNSGGYLMLEERVDSSIKELNIGALPRGIYFLQIIKGRKQVFYKKVIIQ